MKLRHGVLLLMAALPSREGRLAAQDSAGTGLLIFHAGSLRRPLEAMVRAYRAVHPGAQISLESSASLDAVRKLTVQGRVPDLLVVADYGVLPRLVVPEHAGWYVQFARNAMGPLYTDRSRGAGELTSDNWW